MATITPTRPEPRAADADSARPNAARANPGRSRFNRLLKHVGLLALSLIMLYPLIWMLSSSFKSDTEIFGNTGLIPKSFDIDNYIHGWNGLQYGFELYYWNSALISVLSVAGNLFSCSLAAFAIARINFRARGIVLAIVMVTLMLPYHVVVIPQYVMFSKIGWLNTILPLVVPKFLGTDAFFIFLMVQFIRSLPRELDEAARIDGCGPYRIYWKVILPLTLPALATTAIFTFIWTWNDFFGPLLYLNSPESWTVPLALQSFLDATGESSYGPLFAMSILAVGPVLGFFFAAQRYLVEGIATTGVKG